MLSVKDFFSCIRTEQMLLICCDKDFWVFGILIQNFILSFFFSHLCWHLLGPDYFCDFSLLKALKLFDSCFASYWKFLIFISIHSDDKYFFIFLSLLSCSCSFFYHFFYSLDTFFGIDSRLDFLVVKINKKLHFYVTKELLFILSINLYEILIKSFFMELFLLQ